MSNLNNLPLLVLIDTDEVVRGQLEYSLSKSFLVRGFDSPTHAMIYCEKSQTPYAILLDFNMPNIDGLQVLSLLRSHPSTSKVPVICLTSKDDEKIRENILAYGASGVMLKPLVEERLIEDIKGFVTLLNKVINAENGQKQFNICHSDQIRLELIKEQVKLILESNKKVVLLSFALPEELIDSTMQRYIENEQLIYLQMKPQLIVKFPYLTEISSVIDDLNSFFNQSVKDHHLIFDEIRNLLNFNDEERSLSLAYQLMQSLKLLFSWQTFYSTQPSNPHQLYLQQKIARLFVSGAAN
jgi:DNA-binding response OmpR family regulator